MAGRTHVWLLALGAPPAPEGAAAWLAALWRDPDAVSPTWPWLRRLWVWLSARFGAPALSDRCRAVDADTLRWVEIEHQARDLGRLLGDNYVVRPVLRYAGPSALQAAMSVRARDRVVLLPLAAQVSGPTTISPLRHARAALAQHSGPIAQVQGYPDHPLYVDAVVETLRQAILDLPADCTDYQVLFCARGLPGRPGAYPAQVAATVDAVVARSHLARPWFIAYTHAPGPGRDPQPQAAKRAAALGDASVHALILVPVGFTSDHVETRVELDEEVVESARAHGIRTVVRAATVATRPTFLRALHALVRQAEERADWDVPWRALQPALSPSKPTAQPPPSGVPGDAVET